MRIQAEVDFSKRLRQWDGSGVNYVETCQTRDYEAWPQDYGGFSTLSETNRQQVIAMIFGENGSRPGILKMFLDPFHENHLEPDRSPPNDTEAFDCDHTSTTKWMRYFAREGLTTTKARGDSLEITATLYGPPGRMTKQKVLRGRDLHPACTADCARYMISWARFLRKAEGLPVKYISLHNEGEDYQRWTEKGLTDRGEGARLQPLLASGAGDRIPEVYAGYA